MKRKIVLILVILILVGLVFFKFEISGKTIFDRIVGVEEGSEWVPIDLDLENFGSFLASVSLVHELPDEGKIVIGLYNFDTGERGFDRVYLIEKGKVSLVDGLREDADLEISLHSKYVEEIGLKGFCYGIQHAKYEGDVLFENKISSSGFLWKYKSMMKYKDCFGF